MRYGNDNSVRLWDVGAGKELKKLEGHSGCVFCVEWAPDGSQLVRGGQDGEIKWWSPTGECLNTLKGHSNSVTNVEFEQDGATLVSSDGAETIRWDVATGARKDEVAGQFAFTKATNGRYIVTQKDDLIFVYDTRGVVVNADGEEKVPIAFFRAPSPVVSVS